MKKIFMAVTVLFMGLVIWPAKSASAATATLYLSPASSSITNGNSITIDVRENSGSEPVNAVQANLTYPADKFDFVSINSSSAFNFAVQSNGGNGTIQIGRAAFPVVTGDQSVATFTLRAKAVGAAVISFASGSEVDSNNTNGNILSGTTGGNYTINSPPSNSPPSSGGTGGTGSSGGGTTGSSSKVAAKTPVATATDTTPPAITGVTVSDISINRASVSWTTSEPATSEVDFGFNQSYGLTVFDSNLVTSHKVSLPSAQLTPAAVYHFVVKSKDAAGNQAAGSDMSFTTKGLDLKVTVLNQKNQPVRGAKVSDGKVSGSTDANGQVTLSGLGTGDQIVAVAFQGKTASQKVKITEADSTKPQTVTFKLKLASTASWLKIGLPLLLLAAVIFVVRTLLKRRPKNDIPVVPPPPPTMVPPSNL